MCLWFLFPFKQCMKKSYFLFQIIKRKTYFWICNSEGKASNLKVGVHVPNIYQFPLKGDIYLPTLNNVTLLMYLPSVYIYIIENSI